MTGPRLLALMGSGETSPTMVKAHRALLDRVGGPAVLLDTPYGFQMNADDLSARAQHYFKESVGAEIDVVGYRTGSERSTVAYEQAMNRLRDAAYVFAGPGSPSYALRQWSGSAVPDLLRDKLQRGGCVTFASAAALTLGVATVPVYEVYKVGEEPRWLDGLDLLAEAGLRAAVIPHYDNAEGGNHDTRYCYLGEQRLAAMEADLPDDAFVLGVDEHTGVVLDLDEGTCTVIGRGAMTVRAGGASQRWEAGTELSVGDMAAAAGRLRGRGADGGAVGVPAPSAPAPAAEVDGDDEAGPARSSAMLEAVAQHRRAFDAALEEREAGGATQALLDLEAELQAWAADATQSDEIDRARDSFRSLIVRLGEVAEGGTRDRRDVVGPFVETILEARRAARADRRFEEADRLRDALVAMGIEVHDTPDGTEWSLEG